MSVAVSEATVRKVMRRLLPLAMLLVLFNLVDRTNISFAALQMNADLGFTPAVYGLAAGIFFIGYFLFEVPSNLILVRVGARPWLARIMISWGLVVLGMAWIRGTSSFYGLRFTLGVAEAGLVPGVLLYLSRWIPSAQLGLAFSFLMSATAVANVVSGPMAGALMQADGLFGLRGWQLMFVVEGLATIVIGVAVLLWLPERAVEARWLDAGERAWLTGILEQEEREKTSTGATSLWQGFLDRRVLLATLVCFLFVCCNFGTVFWLPQIVKSLQALTPFQIGLVTAVPYLLGGAATVLWGRHSDRTRDRKWHLVGGALLATLGYASAGAAGANAAAFAGLCIATVGIWSMFGVFWAHAGDLLGGAARAAGFAFINSVSTLGGFVGPVLMGFVRERTESFSGSLLVLAGFSTLTAGAALFIDNVQPGTSAEQHPYLPEH